jgi:hypothetical protein
VYPEGAQTHDLFLRTHRDCGRNVGEGFSMDVRREVSVAFFYEELNPTS